MRKAGIGCLVLIAIALTCFIAWFARCGPVITVKRDVPLLTIPEYPDAGGQQIIRTVKAGEWVKVFSTADGKDCFYYKVMTQEGEQGYIIINPNDVPMLPPGATNVLCFFPMRVVE